MSWAFQVWFLEATEKSTKFVFTRGYVFIFLKWFLIGFSKAIVSQLFDKKQADVNACIVKVVFYISDKLNFPNSLF